MELFKLLCANEIVAQIITFLLLLFILKRFMWKPFLKVLDDRRLRIADELKNIGEAKADVDRARSDYERKVLLIEEEARRRMREAVDEAAREAERIKQDARNEGEDIIAKAKENIKAEVAKAEEGLKDRIVELTVEIAGKVVQERLTVEDDSRIVETFINEMAKR